MIVALYFRLRYPHRLPANLFVLITTYTVIGLSERVNSLPFMAVAIPFTRSVSTPLVGKRESTECFHSFSGPMWKAYGRYWIRYVPPNLTFASKTAHAPPPFESSCLARHKFIIFCLRLASTNNQWRVDMQTVLSLSNCTRAHGNNRKGGQSTDWFAW